MHQILNNFHISILNILRNKGHQNLPYWSGQGWYSLNAKGAYVQKLFSKRQWERYEASK